MVIMIMMMMVMVPMAILVMMVMVLAWVMLFAMMSMTMTVTIARILLMRHRLSLVIPPCPHEKWQSQRQLRYGDMLGPQAPSMVGKRNAMVLPLGLAQSLYPIPQTL